MINRETLENYTIVKNGIEYEYWKKRPTGTWVMGSIAGGDSIRIIVSDDNGDTWVKADLGGGAPQIYCFATGGGVVMAATQFGIYRSFDGGYVWEQCNGSNFNSVSTGVIIYADGRWVAALRGVYPNIYISDDNGDSWLESDTANVTDMTGKEAGYYGDGVIIIISPTKNYFIRSIDHGMSWDIVLVDGVTTQWRSIKYGGGVWIATNSFGSVGGNKIRRSVDNGLTWTSTINPVNSNFNGIAYMGDDRWVVCTQSGDPSSLSRYSTDGGLTWNRVVGQTRTTFYYSIDYGEGVLMMCGNPDPNVARSYDGGISYTLSSAMLSSVPPAVSYQVIKYIPPFKK